MNTQPILPLLLMKAIPCIHLFLLSLLLLLLVRLVLRLVEPCPVNVVNLRISWLNPRGPLMTTMANMSCC